MTDTQKILEEFDRKFVKDCGPDVEPIFKDADGSVGPIRRFLANELAKAKAEGVKEERNAIFKDIIEKGGFIGVQQGKEYNCDVVCRLVLDENDK